MVSTAYNCIFLHLTKTYARRTRDTAYPLNFNVWSPRKFVVVDIFLDLQINNCVDLEPHSS